MSRPLRRQVLDAGHDGHRPQPGPQRDDAPGPHRPHRQRALRLGRLPPLHLDVRPDRPGVPPRLSRTRTARKSSTTASTRPSTPPRHAHGKDAKDTDLNVDDLKELVADVQEDRQGPRSAATFPDDPNEQLDLAIKAVFASWFGKRANDYRNSQKIAHDLGTAVNVVTMVFGNMGNDSGTGVAFTRNPNTGEKVLYGEYLVNAQGEDVVAGIRTPPNDRASWPRTCPRPTPSSRRSPSKLEKHYRDVQDLEFTIERGKPLHAPDAQRQADRRRRREDRDRHGQREAHHARRRRSPASSRPRSTSSCATSSTRTPARPPSASPRASTPRPGAAVGKAVFDADAAVAWVEPRARRSSSSARRPLRTTSTAWPSPRAS